jgi:hypothetical protein
MTKQNQFVETLEDLAVALSTSRRTLQDWKKRAGFPKKTARGYNLQRVRAWRNAWYATADEDPLLEGNGGTSKWLESYREEKCKLLRLERLHKMDLVRGVEATHEMIEIFARRIRQGIEQLQREFGQPAADVMCEAIDDAERMFMRWQPRVSVESLMEMDQDPAAPGAGTKPKRNRKNAKQ